MIKINKTKNKGFSLIELMVATSIFVVIMLSAMAALFVLLDGSKEARALRISMDNVNFAMESMTRSIRMGTNYYCTDASNLNEALYDIEGSLDCLEGNEAFVFSVDESTRLGFKYKKDDYGRGALQRCDIDNCVDLISPEINVTYLRFFTFGSEQADKQAGTYIIIKGEVSNEDVITPFSLQTMVSARNF